MKKVLLTKLLSKTAPPITQNGRSAGSLDVNIKSLSSTQLECVFGGTAIKPPRAARTNIETEETAFLRAKAEKEK
ncbi:hypothetical protein [Pseudoalteromonas rubra]|uniref:Uncharacterized protein n=1 Tax=Pseudoalteromonas rubra TaxID=43658 RepID=A0A0U2Y1U2_9GAMM|nr:hypothetical protein [Pseudoalteromonas rubra]ALU44194.1 hypothetical protein AT705_15290 [Pseudoalteromonas rubra]